MANIEPSGNSATDGASMTRQPNGLQTLGIGEDVRRKLAQLSGTVPVLHWMPSDAKETWREANDIETLRKRRRAPMFITSTWGAPDSASPDDLTKRWHLAGGLWLDIDVKDKEHQTIDDAVKALNRTVAKLRGLGIPLGCCSLFASGGKGFHVFIPLALMVSGGVHGCDALTARLFPRICKAFVMDNLLVELTDIGIYNGSRGRMFRQADVLRENGAYKVPLTWSEGLALTVESYRAACSAPRATVQADPVQGLAAGAAIGWLKARKEATPRRVTMPARASVNLDRHGYLTTTERTRIVGYLKACRGHTDYADWIRIGAALKSTGARDAFNLFDAFSKGHPKYRHEECVSKWGSLTAGVAGVGTLVHIAKNVGRV